MPKTNYLIPEELTMSKPYEHLMLAKPIEPKMVFLASNEENFFLNFPSAWEKTLNDALGDFYENGNSRYNFSILTYDGNTILSYNLCMLGMEFKTYLAGLLKIAKTIALYVFNGTQVLNYIICKA